MNKVIISVRENIAEFCRVLGLKNERVCQTLGNILEDKKKNDEPGNKLAPWRRRPNRDIHHHLKGLR